MNLKVGKRPKTAVLRNGDVDIPSPLWKYRNMLGEPRWSVSLARQMANWSKRL